MIALLLLLAAQDARDEVLRLLDQKPQRTDIIVLIDTSGSMHKHFDATRVFASQLRSLARQGDTITLISMAERASELSTTSKLAPPRGRYTDLGAGLSGVADALLRPGYAPISLVFLVTDFCAEPPPGSPYGGAIEGKGPCQAVTIPDALAKRSKQLFASGDQQIRVVALALEPVSEAGLLATREVLGSVVRVDVVGGELETALANMRVRLAYDRAALSVEQLMRAPPLSIAQDRFSLPLSGLVASPVTIVASSPLVITTELVSLRALDDSLRFEGSSVANVVAKAAPWSPSVRSREVELEAKVRFSIEPRSGVEKLLGRAATGETVIKKKIVVELSPAVGPSVSLEAPESVQLPPGANVPIPLAFNNALEWAAVEATCTLNGVPQPVLKIPAASGTIIHHPHTNEAPRDRFKLRASHETRLDWRVACAITAITPDQKRIERGTEVLSASTKLVWSDGTSPWHLALIFGALAVLVLVYLREIRPRMEPASLRGRLVVYDGPGDFRRITIPLKGRVRLSLEEVGGAAESEARVDGDRVVFPGLSDTSAELYAEKSGKRSVMRLRKTRGDQLKIGESELGSQPVVIKRGNARFSIGEYHCRID